VEVLRKNPNPHDLRHTHASWLIADGVPLPWVQARLGHENIQTTVSVYGHLQPDAHLQMADAIARTLSNVRPMKAVTPSPDEYAE
jgi:integrase